MPEEDILRVTGDVQATCRPIYVEGSISKAGYRILRTEEMKIAGIFPMKIVVALSV